MMNTLVFASPINLEGESLLLLKAAGHIILILILAWVALAFSHRLIHSFRIYVSRSINGSEEIQRAETLSRVFRYIASLVSYVSGIPGGIFAPSLAVGAGFGLNLSQIMPYAPAGAIVLLSMVGYLAGVAQAPITSFVIVIEMTDNHNMVLPLMATALIATAVSRLICHRPLYC